MYTPSILLPARVIQEAGLQTLPWQQHVCSLSSLPLHGSPPHHLSSFSAVFTLSLRHWLPGALTRQKHDMLMVLTLMQIDAVNLLIRDWFIAYPPGFWQLAISMIRLVSYWVNSLHIPLNVTISNTVMCYIIFIDVFVIAITLWKQQGHSRRRVL